jgi:hypothetical protein
MNNFYLLMFSICFCTASLAQTEGASKLYGYRQKVMPGTIRVDDNGKEIPRKSQYNYFIYLSSTTKVSPVELWINGEVYSVTVNEVSTPVEYSHPSTANNRPKILVSKTNNHVLQLSPSLNKIQKPNPKGKSLSAKNEMVIIYKGGGKWYYKVVSKLGELDPLAMQ